MVVSGAMIIVSMFRKNKVYRLRFTNNCLSSIQINGWLSGTIPEKQMAGMTEEEANADITLKPDQDGISFTST